MGGFPETYPIDKAFYVSPIDGEFYPKPTAEGGPDKDATTTSYSIDAVPPASQSNGPQVNGREHRRSRTGCQTCRAKRKKCDEQRPKCMRCLRAGSTCHWSSSLRFRYENMPQPVATQVALPNRASRSKHCRDQWTGSNANAAHSRPPSDGIELQIGLEASMRTPEPIQIDRTSNSTSEFMSPNSSHTNQLDQMVVPFPTPAECGREPGQDKVPTPVPGFSPDVLSDDGIFVPGSAYQELHQTLRCQILHTTQADNTKSNENLNQQDADTTSDGTLTPPELTTSQEVLLWDNWINEIGPWLDKFDDARHHQHTLPSMAQNVTHLRHAMLALSARQMERKTGRISPATSLSLYSRSIHTLLPLLHTKTLPVLASCVILCVFEMSSCSPRAWRRHLDGCASLIMDMNITGDQGGIGQSLFWCFARMDVCGGLISSEPTLIPYHQWYSSTVTTEGTISYASLHRFEAYACCMCYVLSRVLCLLNRRNISNPRRQSNDMYIVDFDREWLDLFNGLRYWERKLPPEMQPVLRIAADPDDKINPFPTVVYSSGAAVSGNQLYHTAMLLLLQGRPRGIEVESRSILWHARQICAISMSNSHHGAWTNSVQPLWLAGRLMSHPSEHRAIINLYSRIENETGWGAMWRAKDLQKYWGDLT